MFNLKTNKMKTSIIVMSTTLAFIVLTAFAFTKQKQDEPQKACKIFSNSNETSSQNSFYDLGKKKYTNFYYDVGPRFYYTISKEQLQEAKTLYDFLPRSETGQVIEYKSVKLILLKDDKQTAIAESGENAELTAPQIAFLKNLNYSSSFLVKAYISRKLFIDGEIENTTITPHLTVIPAKQAEYIPGKMALLEYFKNHNKEHTFNLDEKLLRPAKLYFTINIAGKITAIKLDGSCGFEKIDTVMLELLKNLPGKWLPAENAAGQNVEQELVISYGLIGC